MTAADLPSSRRRARAPWIAGLYFSVQVAGQVVGGAADLVLVGFWIVFTAYVLATVARARRLTARPTSPSRRPS